MSRPTDYPDVFGFGDPTPGEPWRIREVARRWSDVADDAASAEGTLRGLLGDDAAVTWIGQAGDNFRTRSSDLPDQLGKVADSYRLASDAMHWWAGRLEQHFGGLDGFLTELRAGGMAGRGWAWLPYDWDWDRLDVHIGDAQDTFPVWNATPILGLDVYEHSYIRDFSTARPKYIDAFIAIIEWADVSARWDRIAKEL